MQRRVDPVLICDQPNCAVYARVGTLVRPEAAELRVWTGPTTSDSISFDSAYLPDLIEGLHGVLRMAGQPVGRSSTSEPPARPPGDVPQPQAPARVRPVAPATPLAAPGPVARDDNTENLAVLKTHTLATLPLGPHKVALKLLTQGAKRILVLEWEGYSLELPANHLDEMLADIQALYYDALRGRRGQALTVGEYPMVTMNLFNQGSELWFALQAESDGESIHLSFPAREVPAFLNAARAAQSRL